jgi:hypothetical protein
VQNVRRPSLKAHIPVPQSAFVAHTLQSGGRGGGSPHSCAAEQTFPGGQWLFVTHAKQLRVAASHRGFAGSPQSASVVQPGIPTHVFVARLQSLPRAQSIVVKHSTHAGTDVLHRLPGQSWSPRHPTSTTHTLVALSHTYPDGHCASFVHARSLQSPVVPSHTLGAGHGRVSSHSAGFGTHLPLATSHFSVAGQSLSRVQTGAATHFRCDRSQILSLAQFAFDTHSTHALSDGSQTGV